jgi:hypothetical protein
MLFSPKIITDAQVDIVGKQISKISTQLTGYSSGFREVANRFGITPFTPQTKINTKGILTGIKQFQREVNLVGVESLATFSRVQKVAQDVIKIDWLN